MMRVMLVGLSLLAAGTTLSFAQDRSFDGDDRFTVTEVDGGVLRVDRHSGEVSLCKSRSGDWTCELLADDRDAMLREIEDLRRENRSLRRQLARLDADHADRRRNEFAQPRNDDDDDSFPTRDEIDEAMDSFEYMMERLLGATERLRPEYDWENRGK